MKKTNKLKNKSVYSELSILELSKILMNIFCYDYVRANYDEKAKVCYLDVDLDIWVQIWFHYIHKNG